MRAVFVFSLFLSILFTIPVNAKNSSQIALQLQWKHQFEFAGFYAAIAKGFYEEAGLEVELFEYQDGLDQIEEVLSGKKQFGIWGDGILQSYMQGKPLVMVANYFKHSPHILVTRPEIRSPADLRGKKVMISSMDTQGAGYNQMLRKFKIDPSEITIIPPSFKIQDFIDAKVDAYLAFSTNEPFFLQQQGVPYNVLDFNSYGAELYEVNLFTSKEYTLANPEKVQAFVEASNRGWDYALTHPDEIIDLILEKYNSQQKSREALVFEYQETLKVILKDIYPIGSIDIEKIRTMGNVFAQNALAAPLLNYQDFIFGQGKKKQEILVNFSEEEKGYLRNKGSIKMCVDPEWMPFEQINENGVHEGMAADLLKLMQQRSGVTLELLQTTSWSESLEMAKNRQCDIFSLAMATPERREYMSFTSPYLSFPFVIATLSDKIFVDHIEQVLDKPLALVKGYAYTEILKNRYPNTQFIEVETLKAGLQRVQDKQVYGFVGALATIAYTVQQEGMSDIKIAGKFDDSWELAIGTRKDQPLLLSVMQKMTNTLSKEEKRTSYNTWFAVKFDKYKDYSMAWKIFFSGLALVTVILYWNRTLYTAKTAKQKSLNELSVAQSELEKTNKDLAESHKIARIGSWYWDITNDKTDVSDEFYELVGLRRDDFQITHNNYPELIYPDDRGHFAQVTKKAFRDKKAYFVEYRVIHPNKGEIYVIERAEVLLGEDGTPVKLIGTIQDITDMKKLEVEKERLATAIEYASETVVITDINGIIQYVNPAFEKLTGYTRKEAIGQNPSILSSGRHNEAFYKKMWAVLLRGKAWNGRFTNKKKDGSLFEEEVTLSPIKDKAGEITSFVAIKRDVTKEIELDKKLQQAQKMETIGTLAGGIAHDFNNILGAIIGYAEMARDDSPKGSSVVNDLDKVLEASDRAAGLVKQILAFSRQDKIEYVPIQPASIVKKSIEMLHSTLPTTIDITQDIDSETGLIFADPTQIHQILMNLCTNAFHAIEETGGKLNISLKAIDLSSEDLTREPHIEAGTFVQLSVSDSGVGIPQEFRDKIFDPYFTTKEVGKGTGMGLSIIHGIVKSYGGFITFYSELGQGTVFHIFLPIITKAMLPDEKAIETIKHLPVGRENILFIDDEDILADLGKDMLERLGYNVTVRMSSLEALETFQNQPEYFDLVITDQTMPGMTGADLARRMLQIRPDIPIILCTGYSSIISEEKAKSIGIREFALKPLTKKNIAGTIRKVLDA